MKCYLAEQYRRVPPRLKELRATVEDGILVLRGVRKSPTRRLLFVNNYGMAQAWRLWKDGIYPGNHLWGCLELAARGYEILLPEPATGRGVLKRLRNDWLPSLIAARRFKADDIVYCAHNVLLWTPFLKALKAVRCKIVGLLFAREPLLFGNIYDGVIAHTPVAEENAAAMYPKALCTHISWGMDMDFFRSYPYEPRWVLSSGKTFRDFGVIAEAFRGLDASATIIHRQPDELVPMPANVTVESDQAIGEGIYVPLVHHYYRYSRATLVTLVPDPGRRRAVGITNLFESMACGRPVIVTRTGAMMSEIDVENNGMGLYVDSCDAVSLRQAVMRLVNNAGEAREMGLRGRQLCEQYYNMDRFGAELHAFFERL